MRVAEVEAWQPYDRIGLDIAFRLEANLSELDQCKTRDGLELFIKDSWPQLNDAIVENLWNYRSKWAEKEKM